MSDKDKPLSPDDEIKVYLEEMPDRSGAQGPASSGDADDIQMIMGADPSVNRDEDEDFPKETGKPRKRRRRSPAIMLVVVLFAGYLMYEFKDDIIYFFHSRTPVDLGAAEEIPADKLLKSHMYVQLKGVPDFYHQVRATMRRSPRRYFRLVGTSRFFVQQKDLSAKSGKSWEREFIKRKKRRKNLSYFNGRGRLMRWRDVSSAYDKLIAFFETKFRVPIPVTTGTFLREAMMDHPGRVWENLIKTPETYILLAGDEPGDSWYFLLIYLGLLGFTAFNIFSLYKYFQYRK